MRRVRGGLHCRGHASAIGRCTPRVFAVLRLGRSSIEPVSASSPRTREVVARARTGADPPFSKRQLFAGIEPDPPRRLPLVVLGKAVLGPPVRAAGLAGGGVVGGRGGEFW